MDSELVIDVIGWIGALIVLLAYGLISAHKVHGSSTSYQMLNFLGSLFLIINTIHYRAYPSSAVNGLWAMIAVYSMVRYSRRREATSEK